MKRILTYLLIAAIIIGIVGVIIYFLTRTGNQPETQTGQTGSLPSTSESGAASNQGANGSLPNGTSANNQNSSVTVKALAIVSDEPALNYFVNGDGSATIIEPDGEIAAVTNNNADIISSSKIQNIISTGFSYDGGEALINFGDLNNPQTSAFDVKAKAWTPLPVGMTSPQWSPTDYRIAYLKNNIDGTKTLTTIDISKTKNNITTVISLHIQDLSLLWLSKNKIMFYESPSVYTTGSVWALDLQKKSLVPVVAEQRGMEAAWSNTTTTMGIIFTGDVSQYGGQLQLVNGSGTEMEQFKFLTLPPKCVFNLFAVPGASSTIQTVATTTASSSTTTATSTASSSYLALYCGVPRDQNALSDTKLPDGYEQMALFTSDNIYRINTSNGDVNTLFNDQNQNMDVSQIKIFNNSLFFINRYDQKLYSLGL
jgi:hypothetical protein